MKTHFLFLIAFFITIASFGQIISRKNSDFLPTLTGASLGKSKPINIVEGTPFFQNEWAKSKLFTPDGFLIHNIPTKINLLENSVYYLDSNGKEAVVITPLSEIILEQTGKPTPAHFIDGHLLPNPKKGWYQLLVNDTISLVKGVRKYYEERIPYGGSPEYRLINQESYFVYFFYQEYYVNKPSDFTRILPSRKSDIEKQIKALDKKLPLEDQITLIASYCNTLPGLRRFSN
ncbi:hypothetical protein [Flavisolibacter tropicus]|uniref:Uncharacterized protein n=1 Tax=Flavisolibacter tropicus TaxID=1492898 RepID=A0A172TSZ7_9BACT|nr:hypothetical protein [Flavisolibacter tropicus]ANE49897.1 hypothetical protein SY85_04715 [Flavisolibacter tropicus]